MLDYLNRHIMHPLMAWRESKKHLRHLRVLERTQFDPPEVIRTRQLQALQAMLKHAWETVPYYRAAWAKAGLHYTDLRQLRDLEAFPVLTKADIRRHGRALVSSAYDIAKLRAKETSGSTGVPLTIYCDEDAMQWKAACTIRSDEWSGYRLGQRVAKMWGNPEYQKHGLKGRLRNHFFDRANYINTLDITDERLAAFARSLRRRPPGLLYGHAHSLYLLACAMKKSRMLDVRPGGIISTSMALHDWQRAVIEEVFGRKVTNRYGCEEVSLIASECEEHDGLHLNADGVYAEVLEEGKLLVTDLTNRGMPLIRYAVGDVVVPSNRVCKCGRGLPLIERVEGREADYVVTPSGRFLSGISLTDNFATLIPGTAQVQLVQESITQLRIRLVVEDEFTDAHRGKLAGLVRDMFGEGVEHEVELVDAIAQEPSGKYRFCISKVATERMQEAGT